MITPDSLELTEKDFDLIIEGLEHLPDKSLPGEMMGELMSAMMVDNKDKAAFEKLSKERKEKFDKRQQDKKALVEDIRILQGKLLLLKRYLKQEGALKEAEDIIKKI